MQKKNSPANCICPNSALASYLGPVFRLSKFAIGASVAFHLFFCGGQVLSSICVRAVAKNQPSMATVNDIGIQVMSVTAVLPVASS